MDDRQAIRISELLLACCDGTVTREAMAELEGLLDGNPAALEYCVEVLMDLNYFHCLAQTPLSQPETAKGPETDFMSELDPQQQLALLGDFAEYEKHADAMEIARAPEARERGPVKKLDYQRPARTINKFSLVAAVLSAAALLLMILYVHLAPSAPYEVATVMDAIGAEWSSNLPISQGTRLTSHSKPIRLTRGIVKLRTEDQVDVVLEAPAEFQFHSYSEMSIQYGKLFARVSEQGCGFSVVTPNSKIVDLGTEFGVLCHIDGNTDVHLYQGKANLFAGEKHQPKTSQLITAGSARRVDSQSSDIRPIALNEQALARNINSGANLVWRGQKAIRLADLLLGGNGFGTAKNRTIEFEPNTGRAVATGTTGYRAGPQGLVPVAESPYLDCLFVPGDQGGPLAVSSADNRFMDAPQTTGLYFANAGCLKDWTFFEPLQRTFAASRKAYPDSEALYLHSNLGLTVDLNAVRRVVPGLRLSAFTAYAGILRMGENLPEHSEADVWVLVDGELRANRRALQADAGLDIRVDLEDRDRFLTLLVTDGGKAYEENWPANHLDTCGFVEPAFELEMR